MATVDEHDTKPRKNYRISISPLTTDALPDLTTAELLAFSGADSSTTYAHHIWPMRPALFRSGVHPRFWPDYRPTIRLREQNLREGKILLMAIAEELDVEGKPVDDKGGVPVAMARIRPPLRIHQELLARRPFSSRLLGDYVIPIVSKVKDKVIGSEADGTDRVFLAMFKSELERVRKELVGDDDWILELLLVHPAYQRSGVGSAMIRHCFSLAESVDPLAFQYPVVSDPPSQQQSNQPTMSSSQVPSEGESAPHDDISPSVLQPAGPEDGDKLQGRPVRIFLEASLAGEPLYARFGFHTMYVSKIVYRGENVSWPVMVCERNV